MFLQFFSVLHVHDVVVSNLSTCFKYMKYVFFLLLLLLLFTSITGRTGLLPGLSSKVQRSCLPKDREVELAG